MKLKNPDIWTSITKALRISAKSPILYNNYINPLDENIPSAIVIDSTLRIGCRNKKDAKYSAFVFLPLCFTLYLLKSRGRPLYIWDDYKIHGKFINWFDGKTNEDINKIIKDISAASKSHGGRVASRMKIAANNKPIEAITDANIVKQSEAVEANYSSRDEMMEYWKRQSVFGKLMFDQAEEQIYKLNQQQ